MRVVQSKRRLGKVLYRQAHLPVATIVIFFFVAVFCSFLFRLGLPVDAAASYAMKVSENGFSGSGSSNVLSYLDGMLDDFDSVAPSCFTDEVFDAANGRYSADEDGAIAGYLFPADIDTSMLMILGEMEEKGWKAVSSGHSSIVTLVKDEGEYRWAAVSCETVGQETSAVINARKRHEQG